MNFDLTDEQKLLGEITSEIFSRTYDIETRLAVTDTDLGWSRDVWAQLAETGILGLGLEPGEAGQIELMVVMTEIGRRLAPEPVAQAALIPGGLLAELDGDAQRSLLEGVGQGNTLLALAHQEPGTRGASVAVTTRAEGSADSWTVTGVKNPVLSGDCADAFVVSAALPDGGTGLFLVDAAAVTRRAFRTFDGQRGAQVTFEAVAAQRLGADADASQPLRNALIRHQSALCAEAVGAMDEALRLTTDYLTTRKQFGVPLSKFQALTQRAADMYVSLELARSMNFYAALCLAEGIFDPMAAARAKLQIGRSGRHIAQEAIQLHGGIGVTAEYPIAHYAARLTAIDQTLGSADDQLRALIGGIGSYSTVTL